MSSSRIVKGGTAIGMIGVVTVLLSMLGCAASVPIGSELSGFVSEKELKVVSFAREGMQRFNASRFFEAEGSFRKALYLDPTLDNVRFNLATTLERTGLFEEASSIYLNLIKKEGDKAIYRAALGRLLVTQGNYKEARTTFHRAISLARKDEDVPLVDVLSQSLVTLELGLGEFEEATCIVGENLKTNKNINNLRQYIRLLLSTGKTNAALDALESLGPEVISDEDPISLYLRTLVLLASGKKSDALELSERVLIFPNLEPSIDFDMRIVNTVTRFSRDPKLFLERSISVDFIKILSEVLASNSLTSLYWSPVMLKEVMDMLASPEVIEILEK